ncbi:MAG: hypothetical protein ACRCZF_01285, partial [Gemmataceae bacterium]
EIIITPDEGGGPRVDIYDGANFSKQASFFGIDDVNFRGGARATVGNVQQSSKLTLGPLPPMPDLIVAAGFGGGPRVAMFDGATVLTATRRKIVNDFFVFEQTLRNGAYITAGDVNGDGYADLIAGGGPGGGPRVLVLNGVNMISQPSFALNPLASFFAGGSDSGRGGITVTTTDLDGDAQADIVVGYERDVETSIYDNSGRATMAGYTAARILRSPTPTPYFEQQLGLDRLGAVYVG